MQAHLELTNKEREGAALHALGCLPHKDAGDYRHHVSICSLCREELALMQTTAARLFDWATPIKPRHELKNALFTRLEFTRAQPEIRHDSPRESQVDGRTPLDSGVWLSQAQSREWQATPITGVRVKQLFLDQTKNQQVLMVKMAAGTTFPAHEHRGPEEFLVVSGDIRGDGFSLVKGDYRRMEANTIHPDQFTKHGCLLLVRSSLSDRFL